MYYSTENTREYHEAEEQWLEVDSDLAPAIDHLITSYPAWTKVESTLLFTKFQVTGEFHIKWCCNQY